MPGPPNSPYTGHDEVSQAQVMCISLINKRTSCWVTTFLDYSCIIVEVGPYFCLRNWVIIITCTPRQENKAAEKIYLGSILLPHLYYRLHDIFGSAQFLPELIWGLKPLENDRLCSHLIIHPSITSKKTHWIINHQPPFWFNCPIQPCPLKMTASCTIFSFNSRS